MLWNSVCMSKAWETVSTGNVSISHMAQMISVLSRMLVCVMLRLLIGREVGMVYLGI